jgi:hypothetical protein
MERAENKPRTTTTATASLGSRSGHRRNLVVYIYFRKKKPHPKSLASKRDLFHKHSTLGNDK